MAGWYHVVRLFSIAQRLLIQLLAFYSVAGSETVRIRTTGRVDNRLSANAFQTSSALSVLLLAMTLYPDVLKRGQDEIDAVVGIDRQPGFQDQNDLPYINAIVKEVLRWRPIAPLGAYLTR